MGYKMQELENKVGNQMLCMAVVHCIDVGFRNMREVTEEDIENAEENGLMTKEFVQELNRVAVEVSKLDFFGEIVPYIKERF